MKTDILQIEQHDDLITILDKIEWCKTNRILLVFPKKTRKSLSLVDLSRLQHAASSLGAGIAIVTTSPLLRKYANAMGIPLFPSVLVAQRSRWIPMEKKVEPPLLQGFEALQKNRVDARENSHPKVHSNKINTLFICVVVVAILGLLVFILPSATLRIFPKVQTQQFELELNASSEVSKPSITGIIPAYREEVTVSGTKSIKSTSTATLPVLKARGSVTLKNLGNETIILPVGTIFKVETDPTLEYATTEKVDLLPSTSDQSVNVEAITPGVNGNISSAQVLVITGELATNVVVEDHADFAGGTESIAPAPGENDYQLLRNSLLSELTTQAEEQITALDANLILGSLQVVEVVSDNRVYPAGIPSDFAELRMTVRFDYLTYHADDILWIGAQLMDQEVPEGTEPVTNSLRTTNLGTPQINNDAVTWKVRIEREYRQKYDFAMMRQKLKGLEISKGIEYLNNEIDHFRSAELGDGFLIWKWLPLFSERIHLEEVYESEG